LVAVPASPQGNDQYVFALGARRPGLGDLVGPFFRRDTVPGYVQSLAFIEAAWYVAGGLYPDLAFPPVGPNDTPNGDKDI
jgi:hypothetical protein